MGEIVSTSEIKNSDKFQTESESDIAYPPTNYSGESHITIPPHSTTLSQEDLIDKIKGTLYGNL
jgi:hypothetical protein